MSKLLTILGTFMLLLFTLQTFAGQSEERTLRYQDSAKQLQRWDPSEGWQKAPIDYQEVELPFTVLIENKGGQGLARLDLADPGLANGLVTFIRINGLRWMEVSLFESWEFEESLEILVERYRETELASSKVAIIVSTPTHPLSQGCNPDDVFFTDGFGNALSRAMPSEPDASADAEERAGQQANRQRDLRESMLRCNTGCTLTAGAQDFFNTPPATWKSKKFNVLDGTGNPVPAWWGKTFYGWRALYACVP